jgi:hypothetical protein
MILPFDVITIVISLMKPKDIYYVRLLNKKYYKYILTKNRFDFSNLKYYNLIYAIKRNKILLIDWLLSNKMYTNKILTYAVVYSNKETICYVLTKLRKYKKSKIINRNLILARQREVEPEIYKMIINYYKKLNQNICSFDSLAA